MPRSNKVMPYAPPPAPPPAPAASPPAPAAPPPARVDPMLTFALAPISQTRSLRSRLGSALGYTFGSAKVDPRYAGLRRSRKMRKSRKSRKSKGRKIRTRRIY